MPLWDFRVILLHNSPSFSHLHQIYILCIPSTIKTQMNLESFLFLWQIRPSGQYWKFLQFFMKYLTYVLFEVFFFLLFHGQNKFKIRVSVNVIRYKPCGDPFLWNRIWDLCWFWAGWQYWNIMTLVSVHQGPWTTLRGGKSQKLFKIANG